MIFLTKPVDNGLCVFCVGEKAKQYDFYLFVGSVLFNQASLVAQPIKNLPAIQKTQLQFLGWEDPLENG